MKFFYLLILLLASTNTFAHEKSKYSCMVAMSNYYLAVREEMPIQVDRWLDESGPACRLSSLNKSEEALLTEQIRKNKTLVELFSDLVEKKYFSLEGKPLKKYNDLMGLETIPN